MKLVFDRPGSSANIFDRQTLELLDRLLDDLDGAEGLVLTSAKPNIFVAGADLETLSTAQGSELREIIELGQAVFNKLESLSVPTVAAIHGACVGGGFELALACDWRAATNHRATKIGLPETQLGILPAWGGSTRLPRLIGLPKALAIILPGKTLAAQAARKKGLVDAVVPPGHVERMAELLLARGKRPATSHRVLHSKPSVKLIQKKAAADLQSKTRGHYPAQPRALEVACEGVGASFTDSLRLEVDAAVELAALPETKHLMGLFFQREAAKKLVRQFPAEPQNIQRVAVIGAGVMGAGIAQWFAARGLRVTLQDISAEALGQGMARVHAVTQEAVQKHLFARHQAQGLRDRITPVTDAVSLHHCDLIVEAATENLELKKTIFSNLAERTREDTILATNTSALPIHQLAEGIPHPERLVGLHFFNPVHRLGLVEIVRSATTSDATMATMAQFVTHIGKQPVAVQDSPGFLVNRILLPYLMEAGHLFAEGVPAAAIDRALLNFGMPMGPLRLLDEIGLDVAAHVCDTIQASFSDRLTSPSALGELVRAEHLGKKTGAGFYTHEKGLRQALGGSPNLSKKAREIQGSRSEEMPEEEIADRLTLLLANEAVRCLEEKIVDQASHVDFAMVMGTGFAPFRGGPLSFLDRYGLPQAVDQLAAWSTSQRRPEAYTPAALLKSMADEGRTFREPITEPEPASSPD